VSIEIRRTFQRASAPLAVAAAISEPSSAAHIPVEVMDGVRADITWTSAMLRLWVVSRCA
jgi:hypothetical protein